MLLNSFLMQNIVHSAERYKFLHGLSCVSTNKKEDSVILGFPTPGTEAF
jgi:hypothetical protein